MATKQIRLLPKIQRVLTLVFFGLLPLGQLQRFQITPTVAVYAHDLVLGGLFLFWMADKGKKLVVNEIPIIAPLAVLVGTGSLSLMIDISNLGTGALTAALHLLRLLLYLSLFLILTDFRKRQVIKNSLDKLLLWLGGGLAIFGGVQYVLIPDMRFLANYGWDDHYYRAVGSLFDPNYLGLMMILTFLLINNKSKFRYKRLLEVLVVFVFALTYSRSSFVTLIGMTAVVAFSKRNIKALIVSVLLVGGLVVVLPSFGGAGTNLFRTASISQRVDSQRQAIEVWKERPILGVGFNAYPAYVLQKYRYDFMPRHASAPDNSYLFVLATTGVIGMAAFLYFIWQLFASLKSNKLLIGSLVAVGIHALFNNSLFYPWVMVWILTLVAEEAVKTRVGI